MSDVITSSLSNTALNAANLFSSSIQSTEASIINLANTAVNSVTQLAINTTNTVFTEINNIGMELQDTAQAYEQQAVAEFNSISSEIDGLASSVESEVTNVVNAISNFSVSDTVSAVEKNLIGTFQSFVNEIDSTITAEAAMLANSISSATDKVQRYFALPNTPTAFNPFNIANAPTTSPLPSATDSNLGRSQVNRLATGDETQKTLVVQKDTARITNISTAMGDNTWHEPSSPYNSVYPYNHVYATKNGLVQEFDDTPNNVRYHLYHPSGAYTEIDNNGTLVQKVTGDGFEIILQNKNVYVKGKCNITIEGECNLLVRNSVNLEVDGPLNAKIKNDLTAVVSGNTTINSSGTVLLKGTHIQLESDSLSILTKKYSTNSTDYFVKSNRIVTDTTSHINQSKQFAIIGGGDLFLNDTAIHSLNGVNAKDTNNDTTIPLVLQVADKNTTGTIKIDPIDPIGIIQPITPQLTPDNSELEHLPRPTKALIYTSNFDDRPSNMQIPGILSPSPYSGVVLGTTPIPVQPQQRTPLKNINVNDILNNSNLQYNLPISKHCTLGDVTINTALSHYPLKDQRGLNQNQLAGNLKYLSGNIIDEIIDMYGKGNVIITSGFRYDNQYYKSQHALGQAVDLQFKDIPKSQYAQRAAELAGKLTYDQLLFEYAWTGEAYTAWIHISVTNGQNRQQYATMDATSGKFIDGQIINIFDSNSSTSVKAPLKIVGNDSTINTLNNVDDQYVKNVGNSSVITDGLTKYINKSNAWFAT
jgi:hypothetical protein